LKRFSTQESLDEWLDELNELLPWQSSDSDDAAELEAQSFYAMEAKGRG
jgi:hypothetical protein